MKFGLIVLAFIAALGGLVFQDQVAAALQGMTALDAIDFIMMFALKATVLAILSWAAYHAPKFIRPWLKLKRQAFRQKRQMMRRGVTPPSKPAVPYVPRLNKDAVLLWMVNQIQRQTKTGTPKPTPAGNEPPGIRFE